VAPPVHRDLRALPKAHLHVHLESTIRPTTVAEIAIGNGVLPPPPPAPFAGFGAFAEHSGAVRDVLRRPEDFHRIAVELCADQAADGVRYVEVTFTALGHGTRSATRRCRCKPCSTGWPRAPRPPASATA
jgi:adenosine deaminase